MAIIEKNYLYSKNHSDIKYNLSVEIIKNHDVFSGYKKTETYKKVVSGSEWDWFNAKQEKHKVLQQLQQLQQLEQLGRLQQLNEVKATNKSYHDFSNISGAILYLDPPYEGTSQDSYIINSFDSQEFYDWAYEMSRNNIVLISSYEISDDRFECVYEFKTARSTFQGGTSDKSKTEKLFMARG